MKESEVAGLLETIKDLFFCCSVYSSSWLLSELMMWYVKMADETP